MNEQMNHTGPQMLAVFIYQDERFFADLRLGEFRPVQGPLESIPFESEQGRKMAAQAGIVTCDRCGMSAIISKRFQYQRLNCMNCCLEL